ncbi:hypothetical protein HU200_024936 [Digitaria exilis]|uniref:SCP domain-containing protein n=1 Tax=Digitaria exilis TaxID=1010633 RepID=A0A835C674_9POAL|nr:hypothetical protein HU200_024936 [Digitaria exilis]CAB3484080.1 unnamed protein product [Digitaria exilis]
MSSITYLAVLSLLAATASAASAAVAPTPHGAPRGPATATEFLAVINAARADARVLQLSWNATVAQRANLHLSWLRTSAGCHLDKKDQYPIHDHMAGTFYRSGGSGRPAPVDVVAMWLDERRWYDRGANACVTGKQCGDYMNVVNPEWRQLGCAMVACPSGQVVAACKYSPGAKGNKKRE